ARHPRMLGAAHFERLVSADIEAGFVETLLAGKDEAGQDQRLRLGAALDQAALDERHVETLLGFHRRHSTARRWKRPTTSTATTVRPTARPSQRPTPPRPASKASNAPVG